MTRLCITICWINCPKWLLWLRPGFNSCGTGRISNAFSFSAMALGAKRRIPAPTASAETKLKTAAVKVQKNGDRMCGQKGDSKKYVKHVDKKWLICDWYTILYTVSIIYCLSFQYAFYTLLHYYAYSGTLAKANVRIQEHGESDPHAAILFTCFT